VLHIKPSKNYKLISHTADIGISAKGKTLKEVFKNIALGMIDYVVDLKKVGIKKTYTLKIKGIDKESLLVNFLNELLNLIYIKNFLPKIVKVISIDENVLRIEVKGENIKDKNKLLTEIKSATYHKIKLEKKRLWYAKVFFDV
jgi:SHS2 domain-containing protein